MKVMQKLEPHNIHTPSVFYERGARRGRVRERVRSNVGLEEIEKGYEGNY